MRGHRGAIVVGALFLALTLYYNVSVPLWEADNEWAHYQYMRAIVTQRHLPEPDSPVAVAWPDDLCQVLPIDELAGAQFRQPPLYYLLGAVALAGFSPEPDLPITFNPHPRGPYGEGGFNVAVHGEAERFPWRGVALAVHGVRLLSGVLGLLGLVAVYASGLLLFPTRRYLALAMMAVNAFIPQYVYSSAVINNDILAGVLGSWCILCCLIYGLRRASPLFLALAVLSAGLAILAKYTALVLLPVVGLTLIIVLLRGWRQERARFWRQLGQSLVVVALACLPLGVWLARNYALSGHIFGSYASVIESFVQATLFSPVQTGAGRLLDPLYAAGFALKTFWGFFGHDNIFLPPGVIRALEIVFLLCLVGVGLVVFDRRQPSYLRVAAAAALLVLLEAWLVNFVRAVGSSEPRGRYFLPIYSVVSFLLVLGSDRLLPARGRRQGAALLPALLLALTIAIPPLLLRPTYAPPSIEASAALRPGEEPLNAVFGDFAELLGYRVEPQRIGLYERAEVTLVWRALRETSNNYTVAVHLLDGANVSHDRQARFPGGGNLATSLWQPGDIFRDTYQVQLVPAARDSLPSLGRIKVAMYCYSDEEDLALDVIDAQGNSLGDAVYFGRLKLAAPDEEAETSPETPLLYDFGRQIALEQFSIVPAAFPLGAEMTVELQWRALMAPVRDYTLFVHLVDEEGNTVAASDQPLTGGYYPSGLWDAGERVTHVHRLPLPATLSDGDYELRIGLYDPATGGRLPIYDADEVEQRNAEVVLVTIPITGHYIFVPSVLREYNQDLSQ